MTGPKLSYVKAHPYSQNQKFREERKVGNPKGYYLR